VKTFSSKSDMVKAGWVFSWDDSSLWDASATYSGAYRGSSASGDGMVSLQLQGHGTVVLTYGSDSSGTVKVFMNGQEKGSASANTVSQKLELVFNTGDILQVQETGSIILIQSVDFVCDITSPTTPVWSYHEAVPSSSLPYEMGYQADLNLNSASYTVMMWLKQGVSEPSDAIIIGQHIGTSTTTTFTTVTVTETTVTVSSTTTTQTTTTDLCQWYAYTDLYSSGYAGGVTDAFDLHSAKEKCIELGDSACKAVTCTSGGACTVRAAVKLAASAYGETSYVPSSMCYLGGYRNLVGLTRSGVPCTDAATGSGFIMYSAQDVRSRFSQTSLPSDMADHLICVKYSSGTGWMYDDNAGNDVGFVARDTDVLIASVDFAADTVTSLVGTDEYYAHLTKGYNSGDLVFVAGKYGTSSTSDAGEVYVSGTYFIVPSVDTVSYPDVLATAASAPSQFTSTDNAVDYYQHQTSSVSEVHMKITNYYAGSNSDNWKVFDGSYTSAVKVQEPDLLWEGEGLQSRVHSVTLYTTTSGNDYTAYFQTSDLSSGSWSSGDIQNATADWVQQSSYWKWTIPIKAETMKLEVRLRGSGLTFADSPDGSQHASRSLQLSGFEVNLRSTVTTTVTATTTTTHTETATTTSSSATTSTITVTTTTLTSFPSVGFDSHADLKCASTGESSSGLTDATEDQCKLACWSSSTCIGFNYAAAGGGADNCKLLASLTSLAAETGTTCYLRMATGMCPYQFQFAFYANSAYCCKTNKEKDDGSGASCDGSALHAGNTVSMCCEGNNFIVCPNPPCADYQSYTSATMHGVATFHYEESTTTVTSSSMTLSTTSTATATSSTLTSSSTTSSSFTSSSTMSSSTTSSTATSSSTSSSTATSSSTTSFTNTVTVT